MMLLYNNIMSDINESGIFIPNYANRAQSITSDWASLLSSMASSGMNQMSNAVQRTAYDNSRLSQVGTDPNANAAAQQQQQQDADQQQIQSDAEENKKNAKSGTEGADENSSDSFLLAMIFKIVPIGVNVLKKGPVLADGLKEVAMSIVNMIANLIILWIVLFIDTFTFTVQWFNFVFTMLLCMVFNLTNLPKCILFYLFDLFLLAVFMFIMSVLLLIDVFFGVKKYLGISCVGALMQAIGSIGQIDSAIYGATGVHVFNYPDFILNLCYRCEMAGDLSGFYKAAGKLGYDLGVLVPDGIGGPIGEFAGGIGEMVSIFSL